MPWHGKLEQLFLKDAQRGMELMLGRRKKKEKYFMVSEFEKCWVN